MPIDRKSDLEEVVNELDRLTINEQKLTPNPQMLTDVREEDDLVVVFTKFNTA